MRGARRQAGEREKGGDGEYPEEEADSFGVRATKFDALEQSDVPDANPNRDEYMEDELDGFWQRLWDVRNKIDIEQQGIHFFPRRLFDDFQEYAKDASRNDTECGTVPSDRTDAMQTRFRGLCFLRRFH